MVQTSYGHSLAILLHNVLHTQTSMPRVTFGAHALMRLHAHDTDTATICTSMLTHLNDALDPSTDTTDLLTSMIDMIPVQSEEGVDCVGVDNALNPKEGQDNPNENLMTNRKRRVRNRERTLNGRK